MSLSSGREIGFDTERRFSPVSHGFCAATNSYKLSDFVLPHASLRQPLRVLEAINGSGSAKVWRPCTPAMAAGLTDHVWTLQEVLLYRVPPWSQPHMV